MLADGIEGKQVALADQLSPARMALSSDWIAEQASATANMAERVWPATEIEIEQLDNGDGRVGNLDGKHTAVCRDHEGCLHRLNPICPHTWVACCIGTERNKLGIVHCTVDVSPLTVNDFMARPSRIWRTYSSIAMTPAFSASARFDRMFNELALNGRQRAVNRTDNTCADPPRPNFRSLVHWAVSRFRGGVLHATEETPTNCGFLRRSLRRANRSA